MDGGRGQGGLQALAAEDGLEWSGLQDVDVSRWLRGEVYPRESLERLCRLFRCHQAQLGWPPRGNDVAVSFAPAGAVVALRPQPAGELAETLDRAAPATDRRDWAAWFGVALFRLIALVDGWEDALSSEALQVLIHQEVLMFDAARPARDEDDGFDPSRRQLLITLLALPVALSPSLQVGGAPSALPRKLLARCAASITAAWHLLKQSDLVMVEQHVSGYVLALSALARQPSAHQAEAARLASLAHRVLGIVAAHRRQFRAQERHCLQALHYAEVAEQPDIQASALLSVSQAALDRHDSPGAAAPSLQRLQQMEHQITPLQGARLHSLLAIALARQGQDQEALRHLHLAEVAFPARPEDDPGFARQDFSHGQLVNLRGLAHLALARAHPDRHHQRQAWETFEQVGRLSGQGAVAERVRVEIVIHQADTALEMRDLEAFVSHLRRGVEGARSLRSMLRLHEAATSWRRAGEVWPREPRVTSLAELFTDSPAQVSADRR